MSRSTKFLLLLLGLLLIDFPAKGQDCGETARRAIDAELGIATARLSSIDAKNKGEWCSALRYANSLRKEYGRRTAEYILCWCPLNNCSVEFLTNFNKRLEEMEKPIQEANQVLRQYCN